MFPFRSILLLAAVLAASVAVTPATLRAQVSLPIFGNRIQVSPLENRLTARTALSFGQLSLTGFAELLRKQFSINAMLDRRALDDVGLSPDTQVSAFDISNVVLEDAIDLVLRQLDLTIVVRDEVLVITTEEEAANELETRVYPVADLVYSGRSARGVDTLQDDYDTLIETITSVIAPDTWDEVGGAGSIEPFPVSRALVISQSREVHRQIGPLLETLRKAKTMSLTALGGRSSQVHSVGSRPYSPSSTAQGTAVTVPKSRYIYRPRGTWQEPSRPIR